MCAHARVCRLVCSFWNTSLSLHLRASKTGLAAEMALRSWENYLVFVVPQFPYLKKSSIMINVVNHLLRKKLPFSNESEFDIF